jgi:uncharacterized LabA/DUF88 family protein
MNRVVFIVDGFNLYHSLKKAQPWPTDPSTRWLDLSSLCRSHLHNIGKDAVLEGVYYISALATHLESSKPDVTKRHQEYIHCIESTGVKTLMNRFKRKDIRCRLCNRPFYKYEEKETDVMLATTLLEQLFTDACDTAVLVTGDSDLAPAVRTGIKLFPGKKIVFAFPFGNKSKELRSIAPGSFTLGSAAYAKYQFPNPMVMPDGKLIHKPGHW